MATSSFLQFNPTAANQETDAAYLTDATRTGGAGVGAIWPSVSANKTLYQVSTAIAALMQMMANKGFTVSDASLAALTVQLANILTTADVQSGLQSVSWASSIALNAARYNGFEISLTGNSTLSISGQTVGQVIVLLFSQDGTGGHTITYPGNIVGGAQPDPSVSTISGQIFKVNAVGTLQALGPMVSSNGMSGVAIGSVNPAAGNFSTLQVASAAPLGRVLTGDGTHYVPTVPSVGATQNAGLAGSRGLYATGNPDITPPAANVYQNTNSGAMLVTVSADGGGGGFRGVVYCDVSPSPTTAVAQFSRVNAGSSSPNYYPGSVTFVVPPGYYYGISVTSGGGSPSIRTWTEWIL